MSRFLPTLFRLAGLLALPGLLSACASARHAEFRDRLLREKPALAAQATLEVEQTSLSTVKSIGLVGTDGREVAGFLRVPHGRGGREGKGFPAVVILAGRETGRDALLAIGDRDDLILIALNYPRGERLASPGGPFSGPRRIEEGARDAVDAIRLGIDYLSGRDDVDHRRIGVVGVSFGGIFATMAAATHPDAAILVLVQSGGDFPELVIRHAPGWLCYLPCGLALLLADTGLSPYAPERFAPLVAPRPVIMINSSRDEFFPEKAARRLYDSSREPKRIVWQETDPHVDKTQTEVIRRLTGLAAGELEREGFLKPRTPAR